MYQTPPCSLIKKKLVPRESYKKIVSLQRILQKDEAKRSVEKGLVTSWVYQHNYPVADKRS